MARGIKGKRTSKPCPIAPLPLCPLAPLPFLFYAMIIEGKFIVSLPIESTWYFLIQSKVFEKQSK